MPNMKQATSAPRYPYWRQCSYHATHLSYSVQYVDVRNRKCSSFQSTGEYNLISATLTTSTHEEDVKVGQSKPGKDEVQRVVNEFLHECHFPQQRVIRAPDLRNMDEGVYLTSAPSQVSTHGREK